MNDACGTQNAEDKMTENFKVVRDDGNGYYEAIVDGVLWCGTFSDKDPMTIRNAVLGMDAHRKSAVISVRIADATAIYARIERHMRECFLAEWLAAHDAQPETRPSVGMVFMNATREVRSRMSEGQDPTSKVLGDDAGNWGGHK